MADVNSNLVASIALKSSEVAEGDPHVFGAILPTSLPLPVIEAFAKAAQNTLVDYAGPVAEKFIEAAHAEIADWVSPKLADFVAGLISEFGEKAKS